MNRKKIFTGMITVVLTTAVIVGFTSCNKDDDNKEKIQETMSGKFHNIMLDYGYDPRYGFEFQLDRTYSYFDKNRSIAGKYRIFEFLKSTGVLSFTGWDGNEYEWEYNGIRKMYATGSKDFDQIWMYVSDEYKNNMVIHLYSNNKFVENLNNFVNAGNY